MHAPRNKSNATMRLLERMHVESEVVTWYLILSGTVFKEIGIGVCEYLKRRVNVVFIMEHVKSEYQS